MILSTIKNIPGRIVRAWGYSLDGLVNAFIKEESFRLEIMSLVIMALTLLLIPWPIWKKLTLAAVFLLIPLTELLNSALEDLCNLVSPNFNSFVKNAKDKGSAAVLLAIIANCLVLAALISI